MSTYANYVGELDALSDAARAKLSKLTTLILSRAKLITKSYAYTFDLYSEDAVVYSYYKLSSVLAKELRRRIPYVSSQFISADRKSMSIRVAANSFVIGRYITRFNRKIEALGIYGYSCTCEEEQAFTGYTASGKTTVIRMTYINADIRVVNPYLIFCHLEVFLTFFATLSRYSPEFSNLSEDEVNMLLRIQAQNRLLESKGDPIIIPDDIPCSVTPLYRTERTVRKGERQHYYI